jgi:RNA polymerase sigma factor (sigma-70 family)
VLTDAQLARLEAELPSIYKRLATHAVQLAKRFRGRKGHLPEGAQAHDLLQEAVAALLSGDRTWPEGLELETVLRQVMRSLAANLRTSGAGREVGEEKIREHKIPGGKSPNVVVEVQPDVEALRQAQEEREALEREMEAVTQDDEVAITIVRSVVQGARKPSEIAEDSGVPVEEIYQGIRRLKRRLEPLASRWRKP